MDRSTGPPQIDCQAVYPLHEFEHVGTGLLGDDLAQQCAEQLDLARERVTRIHGTDTGRLGTDGRIGVLADGLQGATRRGHVRQRTVTPVCPTDTTRLRPSR